MISILKLPYDKISGESYQDVTSTATAKFQKRYKNMAVYIPNVCRLALID